MRDLRDRSYHSLYKVHLFGYLKDKYYSEMSEEISFSSCIAVGTQYNPRNITRINIDSSFITEVVTLYETFFN